MKFILGPIVVHRHRATNNNNWDLLTSFGWLWQQSSEFYYGFDNTCDGFSRLVYGFSVPICFRMVFLFYFDGIGATLMFLTSFFPTINSVLILNSFLRENLRFFTEVQNSITHQSEIVIHPELNCRSIIFAK